jgi:ketosteroid isomerase-like protein
MKQSVRRYLASKNTPLKSLLPALLAVALAVVPAAASEKADVMATVHQFVDGINKGDMKTALAACAAPSAIIDEFPPHAWQGATACADWANDLDTYNKKNGITDATATIGKPRHVDVTGDRAYVVVPATYTYKQKGKRGTESGSILTAALQKSAAGWVITAWAWTKH